MVSSGLKKYAKEVGLNVKSGVAYGVVGGYMVTLYDGAGTKTLAISGAIVEDSAARLESKFNEAGFIKQYAIVKYAILRESVTIIFNDTIGTMKRIRGFLDVMPSLLNQCGVIGDGLCTACGNCIEPGQGHNIVLVNGIAHRVHSGCAESVKLRAEVDRDNFDREEKKLGRGIIGALLGSMLGGIVWAVAYYMGWFFAVIGVLIGFLAKKGYELLGGKVCKAKTVVILLATLFGALFGQVMGDFAYIASITIFADPSYSLIDVPYNYILCLTDPEFTGAMIWTFIQGAFFAVLGGYVILKKSHDEDKNATLHTVTLE